MTKYLQSRPGSIEEVAANLSKFATESEYQAMFKKELEKAGKGIGAMTPAEKKAFFNKIDNKYKAKNEAVDNPYAVGMAAAMKQTGDKPPLKKSTITKAHDIAKSIEKDQKEELQKAKTPQEIIKVLTKMDKVKAQGKKIINNPELSKELAKKLSDLNEKEKDQKEEVTEAKYPHKMYSKDGKEVEAKTPEDHKKYADMGYIHKNETHSFMTKDMNQKKKDAKGEKDVVDPEPKIKGLKSFKEMRHYSKSKKENMDATISKDQDPKNNEPEKLKVKAMTGTQATAVDTTPEVEYKN